MTPVEPRPPAVPEELAHWVHRTRLLADPEVAAYVSKALSG